MLAALLTISSLAMPMKAASAAEPAAIPSQISISIAGGAATGKSAVGINWITDSSVSVSEVVYGTSADLIDGTTLSAALTVPLAEDILPSGKQANFKPINAFNVVLQDLVPETQYYYKVGNVNNGYSAISSFTAPADPAAAKPFSFVVTPDTQGTSVSSFANTADLYNYIKTNESDAAFLIHNGDIVEDASYSDYWQYFFDAAQNLLSTMPIISTPGNHDGASVYDSNFVQYKARFNYSSLQQPIGLSPAAAGTVFSFEYGDALFIVLNSNASTADNNIQFQFMHDVSTATTKKWKIVNIHASPYDPGASHYQVDNVSGQRFTDAGIDLVLSGHEHAYARSTLKTTSSAPGTGSIQKAKFGEAPTYVIGGSVYNYAYSLSTNDTSWNDFFYDLRINKTGTGGGAIYSPGVYSKVEVTSNAILYRTYYTATGTGDPFRVIDEFTITKSGGGISQPIGGGKEPTSVTFMLDSFKQEAGKFIARFNWVTPIATKTTQLFYAKKSDFVSNGGKFTDFAVGTNSTVDLSRNLADANYSGAGTQYSVAPIQSHKAETVVLEPDTEYVYSVGDGAFNVTNVVSPASFKTPAIDLDTFNFNWISDAQANSTNGYEATLNLYKNFSKKALDQAFNDYPDAAFVLSSGDQVNFGFDTWEWDAFFEANADTFARVPLYMATGNHEFDGAGNSWAPNNSWTPVDPTLRNFLGRHNPPKNGASFYGGGDGTQRMVAGMTKMQLESSNYYFVYGDTLFLIMDYQDQSSAEQIKAQQDWMKSVVKQNPAKWRVGVFHKSLFGYRMATPVASWTNAFDEAGVDVVLMGHDHIYVRTKLYANGQVVATQTYGDGTTYLTNYSANTDRRGPSYKVDPGNPAVAYVDVRPIGPGFTNLAISPNGIKVTSKGFDSDGNLQTGDADVLVTDTPRTYNLSGWIYPAVPQDVNELSITGVTVTGIAKEGQTLGASVMPSNATAGFKWERSTDGTTWTAIAGATASNYSVKTEDVDSYLRVIATGTGFYTGAATSAATAKVTPIAGSNAPTIKIRTADDLKALSVGFGNTPEYPNDGNYELAADIDMENVDFSAIGGGTTRIPFIGTFNGKGYTISNLKISSTSSGTGFFSYIGTGGRVVNLQLLNVNITGGNSTGAIAGTSTGTIESSYVEGKVTGTGYTGGIVGLLYAGTLQNNAISVEVTGTTVGGLIGGTNYNGSGSPLTQTSKTPNIILNNYMAGTVKGSAGGQYVGALVGDMGGSSGSLLKTFTGNVASNAIDGTTPGKIAGYWSGSRPIIDANPQNNYDSNKLGVSDLPSGIRPAFTGKSLAELENQSTYHDLGWDFTQVWDWDAVNHAPVLRAIGIVKIHTSSSAGGAIDPEGRVSVEIGESQSFKFTPEAHYEVDKVIVDGKENPEAAIAGEYMFDNVTSERTIHVTFKLSEITAPGGGGSTGGGGSGGGGTTTPPESGKETGFEETPPAVDQTDEEKSENPEGTIQIKFRDIAGHWAEASIKYAAAKGILSGYGNDTFKPNGEVTRAEFAVMLVRILKLQGDGSALQFTDKANIGEWAKQSIALAVQAGFVTGYTDGSFKPNAKVSRAEMVTMIAKALNLAKNASTATAFADHAEIPSWARAAVAATMEQGIVNGVGGNKFAPNRTATRAEAAVVLLKALELVNK